MVLGVGGPLAAGPADVLVTEAFGTELEQQRALFADVGRADLAHAIAASEAGIVPHAEAAALLAALLDLQECETEVGLDPALGDLYTNREAWLSARTPAAGWLGVGRARREALTTAYTLLVRRRLLALARALLAAAGAFVDAAERHRRALMPDYTYLQAGQPTTFGHYLLGFAYPLARDLERLRGAFARIDRCPAGVGSTNGSTLPLDRGRIAELLGFSALVEHARDAMWQADAPIELLAVACAAGVDLDRLAEDLAIFATAEFGFVELADAHSRASKAMPQKKNPFALGYVRAVANRTIGLQAGCAAAGRTPSGQMDNRLFAYGDVPRALSEVAGAATLLGAVVRDLSFDAVAARAALLRSWSFASDLAELVMRAGGTDYRTAHALVGRLRRALQHDGLRAPTPDDLAAVAQDVLGRPLRLSAADLAEALDPRAAVERRAGPGGAAPSSVDAMIVSLRAALDEVAAWAMAQQARLDGAERSLEAFARRLAATA